MNIEDAGKTTLYRGATPVSIEKGALGYRAEEEKRGGRLGWKAMSRILAGLSPRCLWASGSKPRKQLEMQALLRWN